MLTTRRRRGLGRLGAVLFGASALATALTGTPANAAATASASSASKASGTVSPASIIPNQTIRLINVPTITPSGSECLGYAPSRRGAAWIGDCFGKTPGTTGDATVHWTPVSTGDNKYKLINSVNGQCLSVQDGRVVQQANVQVFPCNGASYQDFTFVPFYRNPPVPGLEEFEIQVANSNQCVSVGGGLTTAGSWVILWPCQGTFAQVWRQGVGII